MLWIYESIGIDFVTLDLKMDHQAAMLLAQEHALDAASAQFIFGTLSLLIGFPEGRKEAERAAGLVHVCQRS
jgi:hypothetical protein